MHLPDCNSPEDFHCNHNRRLTWTAVKSSRVFDHSQRHQIRVLYKTHWKQSMTNFRQPLLAMGPIQFRALQSTCYNKSSAHIIFLGSILYWSEIAQYLASRLLWSFHDSLVSGKRSTSTNFALPTSFQWCLHLVRSLLLKTLQKMEHPILEKTAR